MYRIRDFARILIEQFLPPPPSPTEDDPMLYRSHDTTVKFVLLFSEILLYLLWTTMRNISCIPWSCNWGQMSPCQNKNAQMKKSRKMI